jgi:hypothetical protein
LNILPLRLAAEFLRASGVVRVADNQGGNKPVVRLVALRDEQGNRKPGAWEGKIFCTPDAFAPLTDRELNDLGSE